MKTCDLREVVALCKRRGFIFPGSELYGGFANTYSYGPYGALLKTNIRNLWWKTFVQSRSDVMALDGPILLDRQVWRASGHESGFSDALTDCRSCKARFRVDHLIREATQLEVEGLALDEMDRIILDQHLTCPKCQARDFTKSRNFNLMFRAQVGKTADDEEVTYLRPETAQAIFLDYKNVLDTTRARIPFGLAQIGKAFRNEITPGNFLYRLVEFEQMEIEYFHHPGDWEMHFHHWQESMKQWCSLIGLKSEHLRVVEHETAKLAHYSQKTIDWEFEFPFGWSELYGLAYRGNFDLRQHALASGRNLEYLDPKTDERYLPHVIEPTFGLDRTVLALLCQSLEQQRLQNGETRWVLHFPALLAPVQCAIFPLMSKPPLVELAREIYRRCQSLMSCEFDDSGSIGKRYRRQDELGTPHCVTIDYQSLEDRTVTLRDRDSMKQVRVPIEQIAERLAAAIHGDFDSGDC